MGIGEHVSALIFSLQLLFFLPALIIIRLPSIALKLQSDGAAHEIIRI